MSAFDDVLTANAAYAESFTDPHLPGRAARGLAVVTCMDSRIAPLRMLGLQPGDAKILRTAGARVTDDVLHSLVLAHQLLGVERVMVLIHTDCAMATTEAELRSDVQRVRDCPDLPDRMPVSGGSYDVRTGAITLIVS